MPKILLSRQPFLIRYYTVISTSTSSTIKHSIITPLQEYDKQIKLGKLRDDPFQRSILTSLSKFHNDLTSYYAPELTSPSMNSFNRSKASNWTCKLLNKFNPFNRSTAAISIASNGETSDNSKTP